METKTNWRPKPKVLAGAIAGLIVLVLRALVTGEAPNWEVVEVYLGVVLLAYLIPDHYKGKGKEVS